MSERDKWIYELGQRHPNLLFEVSDAYVERRGKDKDEIAKINELLENAEWLLVEQFMEAEKTELSSKITSYLYQNEAAK